MPGSTLSPNTGVFYISSVTQQSSTTYVLTGKYEDYTGFSSPTDVKEGWSVWPNVYYSGYPIAGLYARYNVTSRTVLTSGNDNVRITVVWDSDQKDSADNYFPIAATTCVLTSGSPNYNMAIPTPYRDASANGVRIPYDAVSAINNSNMLNIVDKNWAVPGPTGPQGTTGLSAFSVGI